MKNNIRGSHIQRICTSLSIIIRKSISMYQTAKANNDRSQSNPKHGKHTRCITTRIPIHIYVHICMYVHAVCLNTYSHIYMYTNGTHAQAQMHRKLDDQEKRAGQQVWGVKVFWNGLEVQSPQARCCFYGFAELRASLEVSGGQAGGMRPLRWAAAGPGLEAVNVLQKAAVIFL